MKKIIAPILLFTFFLGYSQGCEFSKNEKDDFTGAFIKQTKFSQIYSKINILDIKKEISKLDKIDEKKLKRKERKLHNEKKRDLAIDFARKYSKIKTNRILFSVKHQKIDTLNIYSLEVQISKPDIFSIKKGAKLYFIFKDNEKIMLLNNKTKVASYTKNKPIFWYQRFSFLINQDEFNRFKNNEVDKFRIHYSKGYLDYKNINFNKIKELFSCI